MKSENASSVFLVAVERLVRFLIIILVVFRGVYGQKLFIEYMYSAHDILDLLDWRTVCDVKQMAVEFISTLYNSLSGR